MGFLRRNAHELAGNLELDYSSKIVSTDGYWESPRERWLKLWKAIIHSFSRYWQSIYWEPGTVVFRWWAKNMISKNGIIHINKNQECMQNFYWHFNLTLAYSGYRIVARHLLRQFTPSIQGLGFSTSLFLQHITGNNSRHLWSPPHDLKKSVRVPRLWELMINCIVCVWWVELNWIKRKPRLEQLLL